MCILVIGQFRVRDAKVVGRRISGLGGKLAAEFEGTDVGPILIAHAMFDKSRVCNGYNILRGFSAGTAEGESVFTDFAVCLEP
jgi:hypothetical protein